MILLEAKAVIVRMHANARGSKGIPPRKILKNRCSEIKSEGISESKYCITGLELK